MRNLLYFQLSIAFLVLCFVFFIIFNPNPESLLKALQNEIIQITLLVSMIFTIFTTALMFSRYINPIKFITEQFEKSSVLTDLFYNKHNLPSEIQRLLLAIIRYQTNTDEAQIGFLAERKMVDSLLENMNDGILIADEDSIVTMINTSTRQIFNLLDKNNLGNSLAEVLRNHNVNDLWQKCSISQQQVVASFEISSTKSFIRCIATPLNPEIPGSILFLFQDLTRMKQLEIIRRDFVSNVSHDLRTPLASLKLIAETLGTSAIKDPPATKRFIKIMDNEIDNMTQMVEELLELSRIESGQVPLEKKWIGPGKLIENAGERMEMQADRSGIIFTYGYEKHLPEIFVDASRLSQVLINLMHNAIKFTPPGGTINTNAYNKGKHIIFSVQDSGIGIPPKELERIFERFYKSDKSRSERGTGLGLSISKHLVEIHGGIIWAENLQNSGSIFRFSIPIQR